MVEQRTENPCVGGSIPSRATNKKDPMKKTLTQIAILTCLSYSQEKNYFQQEVNYEIDVSLNDDKHTLSAYEKIKYKNNSPDELSFLWFHIWPNAYKDDSTAYAKQAGPNSRFAKSDSSERGFIDSLDFKVNGIKIDWSYHPEWIDVVKLNLTTPLKPAETITIETPFFVKLPGEVFSRLGHTGKHYEITQWYPKPAVYDKKGWHPMPYLNQGEFYSEFGAFDVKITLPKDYKLMATGDLVDGEREYLWLEGLTSVTDSLNSLSEKELKKWIKKNQKIKSKKGINVNVGETDDNSSKKTISISLGKSMETLGASTLEPSSSEIKTLHFRQKNVHDFAWFADKNWLVQKGELTLQNRSEPITLWSFYLPKNAELWRNSIEYLHDSGYWFSKYYGDYPYNHITAVDGDLSAGGGMEYPNITVIASMPSKHLLETVIMHEVGHNWFYGIIGTNERYYTWMDEGLNDYSNIRYWQDKYRDTDERFVLIPLIQNKLGIAKSLKYSWFGYFQYASSAKSKNVQPLNLKADEYTSGNYGLNYSKTGVFTRFLQHYLGDKKMDEIMQEYYRKWKYRHPTPEDFKAVFDSKSNKNLDWYFKGVLETTDYIDYAIRKKGNQFIVTNNGTLNTPVEVVFYGKNKNEIERTWLESVVKEKSIQGPKSTQYAIIDPDENMPDVRRENNSTRSAIRFHWVWDQPTYYDHDLNFIPVLLDYNYYNGWTPGGFIYKGLTPGYTNLTSFKPMLDIKNEKLVGKIYKSFNFDKNIFDESKLEISGSQLHGNSGGLFKYNGRISNIATNDFTAIISHNRVEEAILDSSLYSSGDYTTSTFQYSFNKKLEGWIEDVSFKSGVLISESFSKSWIEGKTKIKPHRKINFNMRGWAGNFHNDKEIPNQYRTYLSGGIDPTFSRYVYDRTGQSSFALMQDQYIQSGPALRGLLKEDNSFVSSSSMTWGLNLDAKIPFLPNIFYDFAGGNDFKNTYSSAGIVLGPAIIPLYQSWEEIDQTAKDAKWILDRIRLQFNFNLASLLQ